MTKQIEAETLREWLDTRQPVTVLDIRTDEDRAQWDIPGSVHVNAYGCPTGCRQSRRSWSGYVQAPSHAPELRPHRRAERNGRIPCGTDVCSYWTRFKRARE